MKNLSVELEKECRALTFTLESKEGPEIHMLEAFGNDISEVFLKKNHNVTILEILQQRGPNQKWVPTSELFTSTYIFFQENT